MRELNVGLIGYKFMGKAHSNAYRSLRLFFDGDVTVVMKAICGRDRAAVKSAAEQFGWESYETDWRKLVARPDIDIVDVSTPGNVHKEMVIAAAKAGKHVVCEKPLANTVKDAKDMVRAVKQARVKNMVAYNYRRVPAIAFAKQLIDKGKLGTIYHWRAVYAQDWITDPNVPLVWRLRKSVAGSGSLGDIGSHIIDLAHYLIGEIAEVAATMETFIKERPLLDATTGGLSAKSRRGVRKGKVTVDDAVLFLTRSDNGALGSFEATRFATGRKNHNTFEINGSKGSIAFDLEDMNRLSYCDATEDRDVQGFRSILVTNATHPYLAAYWPPGHIIGWEHTFINEVHDLVQAIVRNKRVRPDFEDALVCQKVMDAVERATKEKRWVKV